MPDNNTDTDEYELYDTSKPTAYHDDLPTVQIPLGRERPGLSIDGEFVHLMRLPTEAAQAYVKYAEQGGNIRIYQCDNCGYLTDSDAFSATTYNRAYECGGCGTRLKGTTQHGARGSATQVHGPYIDHDDEKFVNVAALVSDQNCDNADEHGPIVAGSDERFVATEVNDDARGCPYCVPNHPSHLGRLRNAVEGELTQSAMLHRVARVVQAARDENGYPY